MKHAAPPSAAPVTGDEELAAAVRTVIWDPIEPLFVAIARWITRWLL